MKRKPCPLRPISGRESQVVTAIYTDRAKVVSLINEIRGLCLEYGVVVTPGAAKVKSSLCVIIADVSNELTPCSRENMQDLYDELADIEARLKKLDMKIRALCRLDDNCKRILKVPGIGELTATAIVAAVPNPKVFRNGRHMAAWLGLVPRQSSSGDKQVLLGISTLLLHVPVWLATAHQGGAVVLLTAALFLSHVQLRQ